MNKVVSGDGSATLFNEHYGQTYHSVHGAVTESELVYLEYSGAQSRLEQGLDTQVLEVGFGLGLNFLLTAKSTLQTQALLHYTALENAPISEQSFHLLNYESIEGLELLSKATAGIFQTLRSKPHANIKITEQIYLDVQRANALTVSFEANHFDAIYLDAFSPEVNPELWSVTFLKKLFLALKPGGVISTYCVKGIVRRAFIEAGFEVRKMPGPPGKREVLVARRGLV